MYGASHLAGLLGDVSGCVVGTFVLALLVSTRNSGSVPRNRYFITGDDARCFT